MTYRDPGLEDALKEMMYSDKAHSYVLKTKAWYDDYVRVPRAAFMQEALDYYGKLLKVIDPVVCDCCGRDIQNVHRRGDLLIGEECVRHPERYPCRKAELEVVG